MNPPSTPSPALSPVPWRALVCAVVLVVALLAAYLAVRPQTGFGVAYTIDRPAEPGAAAFSRVEPAPFARDFKDLAPQPTKEMHVSYVGQLLIRHGGTYHFELGVAGKKARGLLNINGMNVAGSNAGANIPWRGTLGLGPGLHRIAIFYDWTAPDPEPRGLTFQISKDIDALRPVPPGMILRYQTEEWQFGASQLLILLQLPLLAFIAFTLLRRRIGPRRARTVLFACAALLLGLVLSALAAELVLRLLRVTPRTYVPGNIWSTYKIHEPGTTTLWKGYLPSQPQEFEVPVTLNSVLPYGWRDRTYTFEKPPGVYRILVIGDSYVEGKEVPLEQTFHKLLEARLNKELGTPERRFEVIALGKGGTATATQIEFLSEPGARFQPDRVILAFFPGNDVRENDPALNAAYDKWSREVYLDRIVPARIAFLDRWNLLPGSYLNGFLRDRGVDLYTALLHRIAKGLTPSSLVSPDVGVWKAGPYPPEWERAWTQSEADVLRMRDAAAALGARFSVMVVFSAQLPGYDPKRLEAARDLDLDRPGARIASLCEKNAIPCLNLRPILTEASRETGQPYYWRYDAHWNAYGHQLAADALMEQLRPDLAR